MVPASTREVTRPSSRRTYSSGVAPKIPSTWKVQQVGYCSASLRSGQRTSIGSAAVATRSRASTTFSRSPALIRPTASATWPIHCSPFSAPSVKLTSTGARGEVASSSRRSSWSRPPTEETVVSQAVSPRRPRITSGTMSAESPGSSANPNVPNATRPLPGSSTSLRTIARAVRSRHHWFASSNRPAPPVRISAATPQPTRPLPCRSQVTGWSSGSMSSRDASAGSSSSTVRTTRGAVGVSVETSVVGPLVTRVERTHAGARPTDSGTGVGNLTP